MNTQNSRIYLYNIMCYNQKPIVYMNFNDNTIHVLFKKNPPVKETVLYE